MKNPARPSKAKTEFSVAGSLAASQSENPNTIPAPAEDFRASYIASRFRLSAPMARAIAALAFATAVTACQTVPAPNPTVGVNHTGPGFTAVRKAATARGEGVGGNLTDCHNGAVAGVLYLRRAIATHGTGCAGVSAYNHGIHARARCTGYGRRVFALIKGGA